MKDTKIHFFQYMKNVDKNKLTRACCKTITDLEIPSACFDITEWNHRDQKYACDVSVSHGSWKRNPRGRISRKIYENQKKLGKRHVCIDAGYISSKLDKEGRGKVWSVGFNGLNGRADFKNSNSDSKRVEEMGIAMRPWSPNESGPVLFCLQIPWDSAVNQCHKKIFEYGKWVEETIERILDSTHRDVILRVHPGYKIQTAPSTAWAGISWGFATALSRIEQQCSNEYKNRVTVMKSPPLELAEQVTNCWCVVTYNSNSSVEAAIRGIPSFVYDEGSMTWDISRHDYDIENPIMPDRSQWLNNISYAQWTSDEIIRGDAFRHLGILHK